TQGREAEPDRSSRASPIDRDRRGQTTTIVVAPLAFSYEQIGEQVPESYNSKLALNPQSARRLWPAIDPVTPRRHRLPHPVPA
ncbi:MAG: hypothetical protein ACRDVP_09215, partial [Acidimicrobiales bacterium]